MEDTSAAVVDVPVSSPESAPSSPPSAAATAPTRPASMLDALTQADQQLADNGGATPQLASATGQPGTAPAAPQGPIPFDVHKTALDNARTKAQAEALRGITPQQFETMLGWYARAQRDTNGFLTDTLAQHPQAIDILQNALKTLQTHPTHGPALKSLVGKALAASRGASAPKPPAMVNIQLEDGSVVAMPRDPAQYLAYHRAQWEQSFGDKLSPLTQTVDSLKAEHDAAVREYQVDHFVTTTYDDVTSWAGMQSPDAQRALATEVDQLLRGHDDPDPQTIGRALDLAYRKVIVPTLSASAERTYAASLKQKAAAQIETASTSAAAPLAKPKNRAELAKYLAALEAGGR